MGVFVMRVWLPDRPGALGAVASRIGAVRGDLVGIDILERGAGRAIDELVIELPDNSLVPLLTAEVAEVDGVDVEHVHEVVAPLHDARLDALLTASMLVQQDTVDQLLDALTSRAHHDFTADWVALVDLLAACLIGAIGEPPPEAWLLAFVEGSRTSAAALMPEAAPDDIGWAHLPGADVALLLGRDGRPFRARERRQLTVLADIADRRWAEVATRSARMRHPANT